MEEDTEPVQSGSVQRSMEIFWNLTNLSLEWSMVCFMGSFVSSSDQEEYWDKMHKKMADSLLDTIKSLKGCWVKLGQFLSTKSGVLPSCYLDAFSQLQDYMPSSDFSEIINTIENDLGYMDDIYKNFDSIPLSSASIAQVHKAVLHNGQLVAIKVQHKSSKQNLLNDIEVLKMITYLMNSAGFSNNIRDYLDEYESYAFKELDFTIEAKNMENAYMDIINSTVPIKVPIIIKNLCSKRVITMEYFDLHKFTDNKFINDYNVNLSSLMYDVYDFSLYQALYCGRFHCDPHPGNLQLTYNINDNNVYPVFLDWGFTTYININQRINLSIMYRCLHNNDSIGYITALIDSGFILNNDIEFNCEIFFNKLTSIVLLPYIKSLDSDKNVVGTDVIKLHERILLFMAEYFIKFPNYFPLSFKVLSEYQSLCMTLHVIVPLFHLIYKNASYSLYQLYNTPLSKYFISDYGKSILHERLYTLIKKMNINEYRSSINGMERDDDMNSITLEEVFKYKRNVNLCSLIFKMLIKKSLEYNNLLNLSGDFIFPVAKCLLESRLSSLFYYLSKDKDNLLACQVCVIRNNKIEVEMSYGYIGKYEQRPISNDCLFPIPGLMFGVLSTIILHLSSIGKIDLYDPIFIYWPEFRLYGKKSIKIIDVLNNKTGILSPYNKYPTLDYIIKYENICNSIEKSKIESFSENGVSYNHISSTWILSEIIRRTTNVNTDVYITQLLKNINIDPKHIIFPNLLFNNHTVEDNNNSQSNPSPEVTTSVPLGVEPSSNYLSLKGNATPGDRGEESETINGSRGEVNREDTTASGMKSSSGPQVEPVADLREAKGEVNRRAVCKTTSGGAASRNTSCEMESDTFLELQLSDDDEELDMELPMVDPHKLIFIGNEDNLPHMDSVSSMSCVRTNCYCSDPLSKEYKRCMIPTRSCPYVHRFVKVFRGNADDLMYTPGNTTKIYESNDATIIDNTLCQVINRNDDNSTDNSLSNVSPAVSSSNYLSLKGNATPRDRGEISETIYGSRGEVNKKATTASGRESRIVTSSGEPVADLREAEGEINKEADGRNVTSGGEAPCNGKDGPRVDAICKKTSGVDEMMYRYDSIDSEDDNDDVWYSNMDVLMGGGLLLDPLLFNYEMVYKNYMPSLNCRLNSLSLCKIYNSTLNGFIDRSYINNILNGYNYDNSILTRFFIGLHVPIWSYGYQKFIFYNKYNNDIIFGYGNSDVSGSLTIVIPNINITITLLSSHYSKPHVSF